MCVGMQVVLFVDEKTVSKGMVKYASTLPRESFLDVSGDVSVPDVPVAGCSCSQVAPRTLSFSLLVPATFSCWARTRSKHHCSVCSRTQRDS